MFACCCTCRCLIIVIFAGGLFFWGVTNTSRESTMYPKVVQDLCGWKIRSLACGWVLKWLSPSLWPGEFCMEDILLLMPAGFVSYWWMPQSSHRCILRTNLFERVVLHEAQYFLNRLCSVATWRHPQGDCALCKKKKKKPIRKCFCGCYWQPLCYHSGTIKTWDLCNNSSLWYISHV